MQKLHMLHTLTDGQVAEELSAKAMQVNRVPYVFSPSMPFLQVAF
jgi:hypothetical protein